MSTTDNDKSLYLLSYFQLALEREREKQRARSSMSMRKHSFKRYIYPSLQLPQNIYNYTVCETWEVQTLSLDPSTHSGGMQTALSTPEHSCKLSYGWSREEVLTLEAFSHITGVRAPVPGSQNCPDGSRKFIFFQITGTGWHTLLLWWCQRQ